MINLLKNFFENKEIDKNSKLSNLELLCGLMIEAANSDGDIGADEIKKIRETLINIGTGRDYTIKYYAKLILSVINPNEKVKIKFDKSKPDGVPRKLLDISLAKKYGWKPKISLDKGFEITYKSFLKNYK